MDPLDTFAVPYDDSDEMDTVMRAFNLRPPSEMIEMASRDASLDQAISGIRIPYRSPKETRIAMTQQATKTKKKAYFKNGTWHKVQPKKRPATPKDLRLYYLGCRAKNIPDTIGFMEEGKLMAPPSETGWRAQNSVVYPTPSLAVRNMLLQLMAPELRPKYIPISEQLDEALKELGEALQKDNYKTHNDKLAPFEPVAQFVAVHDKAADKLAVYKVTITLCEPTSFYPFNHYRMDNAENFLSAPKTLSQEEAEHWLYNNVARFSRREL